MLKEFNETIATEDALDELIDYNFIEVLTADGFQTTGVCAHIHAGPASVVMVLSAPMPFLLEDVVKEQGGKFSKGCTFEIHVVQDGLLITSQNPPSSEQAAKKLLKALASLD